MSFHVDALSLKHHPIQPCRTSDVGNFIFSPLIDNRVWDTYQTTPPMSTYSVAFMVSELHSIPEPNRKFTVFARKDMINDTRYALKEGQVLLTEMETYMGMAYSLPKMDLVAVPNTTDIIRARENWGFATFP